VLLGARTTLLTATVLIGSAIALAVRSMPYAFATWPSAAIISVKGISAIAADDRRHVFGPATDVALGLCLLLLLASVAAISVWRRPE
jgi:hypothetical protein